MSWPVPQVRAGVGAHRQPAFGRWLTEDRLWLEWGVMLLFRCYHQKESHFMTGIQFVTDEKGRKVGVLIDLKKHGWA